MDNLPIERARVQVGIGRPITSQTPSAQSQRCKRMRGPASSRKCVFCIEDGYDTQAYDWAHVHGKSGEDLFDDFIPLCRSCHMIYDGHSKRGWDNYRRERTSRLMAERWEDPEFRRKSIAAHTGPNPEMSRIASNRPRDEWGQFIKKEVR